MSRDWTASLGHAVALLRAVVRESRRERITFVAGSIAYHAFVSLLPLLFLVLAVLTAVGDVGLRDAFLSLVAAVLTPGARRAVLAELRAATASTGVSLLGTVVLLWGTLRVFRGLDTAFSGIYETRAANTFLDGLRDGFVVLVSFVLVALAAGTLEGLLPPPLDAPAWFLHRVTLVVVVTAALYPLYYVFPDTDVGVVEALPGALFAGLGLATTESLFRLYVAYSGRNPESSVVAGILVLLTWLYLSGLVILVGAVLNAVLGNRSRDVAVEPLFGGGERAARPSETDAVASVERLERLIAERDGAEASLVVRVGDETVTLPWPSGVVAETDPRAVLGSRGPVTVELQWRAEE